MVRSDTRFQPPDSGRQVFRRRLLLQLQQGPQRRLTTIVAPPGYGKTSTASQWFKTLADGNARTLWISLEAEDRDQAHFLTQLLAGLDRAMKRGTETSDIGSLPVSALRGVLLTRVKELKEPLVLFLDDYHLAQTDPTEALMAKLLSDRDAERLKLVLISRTQPRFPISALRINGELRRVDVDDLRFSQLEAQEFFGDSAVKLSSEQIERLTGRSEGWAVALQMMRVLINEDASGAEILSALGGGDADMGRYLSEQVVSSLPRVVRQFLLETAALPAVSAELAVATSGHTEAAELFFGLTRYALPLANLDREGHWVRYHPVFKDFLTEEAERQGIDLKAGLRRAASWFEVRGEIETAVRHALLAGAAPLAASIVEKAGGWRLVYVSSRGGMAIFSALIAEVAHLDLPAYPLTALGLAVISAKAGQLEAANHYLWLVEAAITATDAGLQRQIRVVKALLSLYTDRRLSTTELSELENDLTMDRQLELVHRGLLLNLLSFNFLNRTLLERAVVYGELAIRCLRDSGAHFGAMHQHIHVGQAAFFAGNAANAEESYRQLIQEAQTNIGKGSDLDAIGQVLMAELDAERGNFQRATASLEWALPHVERHDTWFDILAAGFMTRQKIALVERDFEAAHTAIEEARRAAHRRGFDRLKRLIDTEQLRLLIASGNIEEARRFAQRTKTGPESVSERNANDLSLRLRGSVPALLWIRLWLETGELTGARDAFGRLKAMQADRLHVLRQIELDLLEIRLLVAEARPQEAAQRLSALFLSVPVLDYRASVLVEGAPFGQQLVALAGYEDVPAVVGLRLAQVRQPPNMSLRLPDGLGVPAETGPVDLTRREQVILRLLSSGYTNKYIGRRLELTDNTVKFHLRNIFGKLQVNTRTGAVAAARHLGLLV